MPVGLRNLGAECWLLPGVIVFMLASFRPSPRLVSKTKYDEAYCNLETISTIQFLLSRRKQIEAHTFSYEDGLVDSIIKSAGILGLYPNIPSTSSIRQRYTTHSVTLVKTRQYESHCARLIKAGMNLNGEGVILAPAFLAPQILGARDLSR